MRALGLIMVLLAAGWAMPVAAHNESNPYGGAPADHHHPDCEDGQPAVASDPSTGEGGVTAGPIFACEGEHWDGDDHAVSDGGANEVAVDGSRNVVAVNNGPGNEGDRAYGDVGVRASNQGDDSYVMIAIGGVGETGVGAASNTVAWYGEDHTNFIVIDNVLARVITIAGITRGHVEDDDCDYETYELGRPDGVRSCGRDNTAITVEIS